MLDSFINILYLNISTALRYWIMLTVLLEIKRYKYMLKGKCLIPQCHKGLKMKSFRHDIKRSAPKKSVHKGLKMKSFRDDIKTSAPKEAFVYWKSTD